MEQAAWTIAYPSELTTGFYLYLGEGGHKTYLGFIANFSGLL
jgi:hypothetical protein